MLRRKRDMSTGHEEVTGTEEVFQSFGRSDNGGTIVTNSRVLIHSL